MAVNMELDTHLPEPDVANDASGDESDEPSPLAQPTTTTEKRRAQNAHFKEWVVHQVQSGQADRAKKHKINAADEELSIQELLAKQESTEIIKDPREYQLELFERAKAQNTIAVLDTGSGKTLIAVLLLRHILDQELEDRQRGLTPRIAFFLVPTTTLVFQQFAVLECNLDHAMARIHGSMGCDLWQRAEWQRHLDGKRVIVCTPEVLHQCLFHSFINMGQINLLVFDEAHHTKKNHPYAKIIKEYYLPVEDAARPRIFGMTASPVDARVDVVQAASELETLLHSQIATTCDMTLLQQTVSRPDEELLRYPALPSPIETLLYSVIKTRFGKLKVLVPMLEHSKAISAHLGRWCSDAYWDLALTEKIKMKVESRIARAYGNVDELNAQVADFQAALDLVRQHNFTEPRPNTVDLTAKVLRLLDYLHLVFERPTSHRCIIFVQQRQTARLICKVLEYLGGPNIHPGFLIGSGSEQLGDASLSYRDQVVTLRNFRNGGLNCLIATSVAEEGLDVPDCNLVIRFDLADTMIKYVQSRGRARHRNSKFVEMIELGNTSQDRVVRENRHAENLMKRFCEALPADRYLQGDDSAPAVKDAISKAYVVPSTGAKITYATSLTILAHFVSLLPSEGDELLSPNYIVSPHGGKFQCEVILPACSPIRGATGVESSKKALAKCSAAFNACVELRNKEYLDENLLPIYKKRLPAMRNAALAVGMKKQDLYPMRLKPKIWEFGRGIVPSKLHAVWIDFSGGLDRPHQPLLLLSRKPLQEFPAFPLYLDSGKTTEVLTRPMVRMLELTDELLTKLTMFTLRVFKDIFNKTYEFDAAKMPYWIAPAGPIDRSIDTGMTGLLDWQSIDAVCSQEDLKWSPEMPSSLLLDKFLVDPWHGGNRYFTTRVAPEYKPTDPVPPYTAKPKNKKFNDTILDYSISLFKKSREKVSWNLEQPVLEARKVLHRRNMLASPARNENVANSQCFVCPEPLRISTLSPPMVATCLVFPAIIHRLEEYLIALDACKELGLVIETSLALEAITKDSDNTEDHQNHERINFQSGMGRNYERLEFLGDCFLKMATSIAVFNQYPNDNEFDFHVNRMLLLCNKNLYNVAREKELYQNIRSRAFSRRTWYPEGPKLLEGKGVNQIGEKRVEHSLGEKTLADVSEALMGAALLSHNNLSQWAPDHWNNAVTAVTVLVGSNDHLMREWSDYSKAYDRPAYQLAKATASQLDLAQKVEMEHSYHFQYPRLLRSAFNHSSLPWAWEKVPSYQRLEFLGDSLLDMACVTHLFYQYPDRDPQWLTEHKMAMVANKFLGALCVKLGFHRHLRCNTSIIEFQVRDYVTELQEAERTSNGAMDYWTTVKDPPKCLPDIVEAYLGAMFIDSDFDYGQVQRFFDMHIKQYFEDMSIYDTFANNHPAIRLSNLLSQNFGCREYRIMADEIPSGDGGSPQVIAGVLIHQKTIAASFGKSSRYTKPRAAHKAMEELQGLAPYEFRNKFGCDCHLKDREEDEETTAALDTAV